VIAEVNIIMYILELIITLTDTHLIHTLLKPYHTYCWCFAKLV